MTEYMRNGRGSAHSHIPYSAWQRHTPQCDARGNVTKGKGLPCKKCRAYDATQEVRFYALSIAVFITRESVQDRNGKTLRMADIANMTREDLEGSTFVCPLTFKRVPVAMGEADRVMAGHNGGRYEPGNVCLVSAGANLAREAVTMDDSTYAADVSNAHKRVTRTVGVWEGTDMPSGYRAIVSGGATYRGKPDADGITNGPYGA